MYKILYTRKALKHIPNLKSAHLDKTAKSLIDVIRVNPFQNPPPYESLSGELQDLYSRRLNIKHRLVYEVNEPKKEIKIISMWTHYENL